MFDLSLGDLAIRHSKIAVRLQLHGCREVTAAFICAQAESFPTYLITGWLNCMAMLELSGNRQFVAPLNPADSKKVMEIANRYSLEPSDPLYPIVTDYHAFQHMREGIRRVCARLDQLPDAEAETIGRTMCASSLWLMLYRLTGLEKPGEIDPTHANIMRWQTWRALQAHGRAYFSIASSKNRAYVQTVSEDFRDLTDSIQAASHSTKPSIIHFRR